MEAARFAKFTLLLDGIHKCINRIKEEIAPTLGVKSVHVFWIYQLLQHPEGMTSAEIAQARMIDRSLVSRELEILEAKGYISSEQITGRRKYNSRIKLTEKGTELAHRIADVAMNYQDMADSGISEEELVSFYSTLEKLHKNFVEMTTPSIKKRTCGILKENYYEREKN